MALREGTAGAGFQVALEADGDCLIGEFHDDVELPGSAGGGVWTPACVVVCQPVKLAWFTEPKLAEGERRMVGPDFGQLGPDCGVVEATRRTPSQRRREVGVTDYALSARTAGRSAGVG